MQIHLKTKINKILTLFEPKMSFKRIVKILSFIAIISLIESYVCPDRTSKCRDGFTCCKSSSEEYVCCPLESAECCSDGLHCCPNGTKCDQKNGSCLRISVGQETIPLKPSSTELCPDKNQTCPQFETCCKEKTGGYGCCPYNLAVCCKDLLHCCPHGTRCDVTHQQCVRPSGHTEDNEVLHYYKTMRLIGFEAQNLTRTVCFGSESVCPDGNTCCKISDSEWGCCPLKDAVCCQDMIHCCPNGHKCTQSGCQSL